MVTTTDFESVDSGSTPDEAATLYLIAHKVRGKPAFDIAIILDTEGTATDPAPWWIVPTSGHRARPYWSESLVAITEGEIAIIPPMPDPWPDHYATKEGWEKLGEPTDEGMSLLAKLGLLKPKEPIRRRV